jgi:hypothetical protein
VGADALFEPVVDGPQVEDRLHVAPAALDFQELLVAGGDVLGAHLRVGAAQQVLAVEVLLGLRLRLVGAEQAAGGDAQEPVQARHRRDLSPKLGPLRHRELVGPGDRLLQRGDHLRADGGVADGLVRVEADDEPVACVREPDLLDLQVPGDGLVASLPRQGRLRLGGAGAELLPDDVGTAAGLQEPEVLLRGEAAVPGSSLSRAASTAGPARRRRRRAARDQSLQAHGRSTWSWLYVVVGGLFSAEPAPAPDGAPR